MTQRKPDPPLPPGYSLPLRRREEIAQYLVYGEGMPAYSTRRPRAERDSQGLFCFDVKLRGLDLSFDHLLALYEPNGHGQPEEYWSDPRWRAQARQKHARHEDALYEWAIEEARATVTDEDTWRCLWWSGDSEFQADYDFVGRSGGWLRLAAWGTAMPGGGSCRYDFTEGVQDYWFERFRSPAARDPEYGGPSLSWYELRKLYATIRMLEWDFQPEEVRGYVEDAACFRLVASLLEQIEDPRLPGWRKSEASCAALTGPRSGW